ncbi:helix-turn-helix domain-containing protein [Bacteroides sp. 224]|uniref:helix-turn-helix domain-containing protein n=1 Tax=Bacteroides sp. 224 TaxID=2302936 RepID=UPI0013D272E5|nr:helix-turn-helix transcriptional regulator [Bacteroides sp. 224]NDV64431.1 XRE family transcriptional regulator [Bacteroides sp. 224]
MDIKDRINLIMENENMKSGTFAESIGVQQSTLSHILNGRNKPSLDVIMKVHQAYSHINLEWLLYGTGEISDSSKNIPFSSPSILNKELNKENKGILPSLFDQNPINPTDSSDDSKNRKEKALEKAENISKETVIQEVRYIERPPRKITEIRIFFDDNTYEIFKGEK